MHADFAAACVDAPAGAALLALLEHDDPLLPTRPAVLAETSAAGVRRAMTSVGAMSFDELCLRSLEAADLVGPWTGGAHEFAAASYRAAAARLPLAEAIADRFGASLHAPLDGDRQEWWTTDASTRPRPSGASVFADLADTYGSGEMPSHGLWTATSPPTIVHDDLVDAWELMPGPISRWGLPVRPGVRVHEIHRADDWARLVHSYPIRARRPHGGWELPGINQQLDVRRAFAPAPSQRAARWTAAPHLVPSWPDVAADFDAVHLSWAGLLTSEGYVHTGADGAVAMLRYWFSERTLWLADCFGEPRPMPAPMLSGRVGETLGVSAASDPRRQERDRQHLDRLLGR